EGFDDGGDETARADTVGAHVYRLLHPVGPGDERLHRRRIFGAEIEDVTDLDTARRNALLGRELGETFRLVLVRGGGVKRSPFVDDRLQTGDVVEINVRARDFETEIVAMAEDFAFASVGEDDEFVRKVAADRSAFRHHRNRA